MSALSLLGLDLPVVSMSVHPEQVGASQQRSIGGSISTTYRLYREFVQVGLGLMPLDHCRGIRALVETSHSDTWDFCQGMSSTDAMLSAQGREPVTSSGTYTWNVNTGLTITSGLITWPFRFAAVPPRTIIVERDGVRTVKVWHSPGSNTSGTVSTFTNGVPSGIETLAWLDVTTLYHRIGLREGTYTSIMVLSAELSPDFAQLLSTKTGGMRFGYCTPYASTSIGNGKAVIEAGSIDVSPGPTLMGEMSITLTTEAK